MTSTQNIGNISQRIKSLDVFRAITMFLMLFVNDIPGLKNIPHWLLHARFDEDMLGFSDTIFPAFLFAMGMAVPYAIQSRIAKGETKPQIILHIFWRTLALVVMGLFAVNLDTLDSVASGIPRELYMLLMVLGFFLIWSVYPKSKGTKRYLFNGMKAAGIGILLFLFINFSGNNGESFSPQWWGILGLIGWTYVFCALVYLFVRDNLIYLSVAGFLLIIISLFSAAGVFKGIAVIDNLPSQATLYAFGMSGVLVGVFMQKSTAKGQYKTFFKMLMLFTAFMLLAGVASHQFWIVSKIQGTPTWYFYCMALFLPFFMFVYWLCDMKGKSSWFDIIKPAGTATLTCYIIPYAWYSIQSMIGFRYPDLLTSGVTGIIRSLVFSLIIIGITWLLIKAKIRLKV